MPRSTLTSKAQIALPKEIRHHLGPESGDPIELRTLRGIVKRRGKRVSLAKMGVAVRRGAAGR